MLWGSHPDHAGGGGKLVLALFFSILCNFCKKTVKYTGTCELRGRFSVWRAQKEQFVGVNIDAQLSAVTS